MKLEIGDMWTAWAKTDHFIFTGNSFVKRNGALVMGRGIARTVRDKWLGVDMELGSAVNQAKDDDGYYGVILGRKLGVFQVKYFWGHDAEIDLIAASARALSEIAVSKPHERFDMNFPGIGNGKLDYETVLPVLGVMPDNVHVWKFK